MYETVIWATDGSEAADAALDEATRLARTVGARIVAVHCDQRLHGGSDRGSWTPAPLTGDPLARIRRRVEALRAGGTTIELIVRSSHGEAADTVAAIAAELQADVVVCGTRGLGALSEAFLGSFTQRLLHVSPCPVLAVGPRGELNAAIRLEGIGARA